MMPDMFDRSILLATAAATAAIGLASPAGADPQCQPGPCTHGPAAGHGPSYQDGYKTEHDYFSTPQNHAYLASEMKQGYTAGLGVPGGGRRRRTARELGRLAGRLHRRLARLGIQALSTRCQVLITAAELSRLIDAGDPVTILDVRWRLDEPDGQAAYLQGHLPGAVYVSLEDELSDHTVTGRGRHPLPSGRSCRSGRASLGRPPGRADGRLRRLESRRVSAGLVGADRGRTRRRPHPGRRPVRVAVRRRRRGHRPGHAAARRCDRGVRRPVRRRAADPDGAAGRATSRCSTPAHRNASAATSSRSIRWPDTSPARRTCPAAACSPTTELSLPTMRSRDWSPTTTARSARTAVPASRPASRSPRSPRSDTGQRCSPAPGRSGVQIPIGPSRAATNNSGSAEKVCHAPSTAMRFRGKRVGRPARSLRSCRFSREPAGPSKITASALCHSLSCSSVRLWTLTSGFSAATRATSPATSPEKASTSRT